MEMNSPKKIETRRMEINIPVKLLEEIAKYQEEHAITNRTITVLEILRKGLHLEE
jgi:metal-responsive CopG/Arc/MetJ family transcriptional regulator